MRSTLCTLFFFLIGSTGCINAESGTDFENTVLYMQKFGYIENAPLSYVSKNLFTEALKTVQKYGNIPTTGALDEKTEKLIKSPRCGVKDVENLVYRKDNYKEPKSGKLYKLNSDGWWQREINYYISNSTVKLEENTVEDILRKAFDTWHGVSGLIFREVWMLPEADITIVFFRGGHSTPEMAEEAFDGPGKVLAHTSMPGSDGIKPTFVHFDEDEEWVSEAGEKKRCKPKGVDFFNVALHELGHALGLSHTFTEGSIMSPYFNSDNVQLGYADALGMYELYVRSRRFGEIGDVKKPDPIDYPPHPKDKLCDGNFDAALARYEELFLFKGKEIQAYRKKHGDQNRRFKRRKQRERTFHKVMMMLKMVGLVKVVDSMRYEVVHLQERGTLIHHVKNKP